MRGREVLPRFCYIFEPELRKLCARQCNRLIHVDAFFCVTVKEYEGRFYGADMQIFMVSALQNSQIHNSGVTHFQC